MFILDTIRHRLKRGCETIAYPHGPAPALPDRHGGALKVDAALCALAAHRFLLGDFKPYGESATGFIIVPASAL